MSKGAIDTFLSKPDVKADQVYLLALLDEILSKIKVINDTKISLSSATKGADIFPGIKETTEQVDKLQTTAEAVITTYDKLVGKGKAAIDAHLKEAGSINTLNTNYEELIRLSIQNELFSTKLKEGRKLLNDAYKNGAVTTEDYAKGLEAIKIEEIALKNITGELNLALKNTDKFINNSAGSLEKMRAELKLSLQAFDKLSAAEKSSGTGQALIQRIEKITEAVSKEEQATKRFQRNVGNYEGSAKIIVDAMERARVKMVAVEQQFGMTSPEAVNVRREFENLQRITDNPQFLNISAKAGDSTRELKFFTKALIEMERNGQGSSDAANELRQQLARLTDEIGDVRQEIKAMSSDSRGFDLFAGSVNFAADALQTYTAVAVLAGQSEEDAAESIKLLVAVQSLSNGVKGIATELTTKGTAANKAYAFVTAQVGVVTSATTTATQKFGAALKLTGIVALITGIGFLITKLSSLGSSSKNAASDVDVLTAAIENQNRVLDNNIAKIDGETKRKAADAKERGESESKVTDIIAAGFLKQQTEYIKQIEERKKTSKGYYDAEGTNIGMFVNSTNQATRSLNNITTKLIDPDLTKKQKADLEASKTFVTGLLDLYKKSASAQEGFQDAIRERRLRNADKERADSKKGSTDLLKDSKDAAQERKDFNDAMAQVEFDLQALEIQRRIDFNSDIATDDTRSLSERVAAEKISYDARLELIILNADLQKELGKKTAEELKLIEAQKNDAIIRLDRDSEKQITDITISEAAKRKEEKEKIENANRESKVAQHEIELQNIQNAYDKEITALDSKFADGEIKEKAYNLKKLQLGQQLNEDLLIENIKFAKAQLEIAEATALASGDQAAIDKVAAAKGKLAALEISLFKLVTDARIKSNADGEASDKAAFDKRVAQFEKIKSIAESVFGVVGGFIGASAEKEKNEIQAQIDAVEKKKQKDIEAAAQTIGSAQEKADVIAVIEARAASKKEALLTKQRQADQQRAVFEKASTIASIILQNVLNVVKAAGSAPPPFNVPAIIGAVALGAAQLAVAVATPIPRYKDGTTDHTGGKMIVGDGNKRELVIEPTGKSYITPDTATLMDAPRHTIVLPDADAVMNMAGIMQMKKSANVTATSVPQFNTTALAGSIKKMEQSVVNAIKAKQEIHFDTPSVRDRFIKECEQNKQWLKMNGF